MKKLIKLLTILSILPLYSCGGNINSTTSIDSSSSSTYVDPLMEEYGENIDQEILRTYQYFKDTTNLTEGSEGYGLVRDRYTDKATSSIAATGFALASYPIYVEEGFMEKSEANEIVSKTMDTLLRIQEDESSSYGGCLKHFININTGVGKKDSEVSTIDTAILVSGAIICSEYFDETVSNKVNQFWSNVNFNDFAMATNGQDLISMGVSLTQDETTGEYKATKLSGWDFYAEQLMIYIIGAGNPNEENRIDAVYYKDIKKQKGRYRDGNPYIYSWFGSIFTYQFSHCFFDFNAYLDYKGVDWNQNSIDASLANYQYCVDNSSVYKTFSESSWGLTACDTPSGYSGDLGAPARGWSPDSKYSSIEGTIAPAGAIGSVIFTPEQSLKALKNYQSIQYLNHDKYGLFDSYMLKDNGTEWYDNDFIGIDKGVSILMLYNYKNNNFIQSLGMKNEYVIEGFLNNGFVAKE